MFLVDELIDEEVKSPSELNAAKGKGARQGPVFDTQRSAGQFAIEGGVELQITMGRQKHP